MKACAPAPQAASPGLVSEVVFTSDWFVSPHPPSLPNPTLAAAGGRGTPALNPLVLLKLAQEQLAVNCCRH